MPESRLPIFLSSFSRLEFLLPLQLRDHNNTIDKHYDSSHSISYTATNDQTEQNPLPPQDEAQAEHTSSRPQVGAAADQEKFHLLDLPLELVVRALVFAVAFKLVCQFIPPRTLHDLRHGRL